MLTFVRSIHWSVLIVLCLTIGLAPFVPEPHVWEKLKMLLNGTLTRPIDIFDFAMHGLPFMLLFLKLVQFLSDASRR